MRHPIPILLFSLPLMLASASVSESVQALSSFILTCGPFQGTRGDYAAGVFKKNDDSMSAIIGFVVDLDTRNVAIVEPGEKPIDGVLLHHSRNLIVFMENGIQGVVIYAHYLPENIMLISKYYRSLD